MCERQTPEHWDRRYRQDDLPWDTGIVSEELKARLAELRLVDPDGHPPGAARGRRALEIGCGTGTNALWLAMQGFATVATDVSPAAVATAAERAERAGVRNLRLLTHDILDGPPVEPESVDLAFDRGCLHAVPQDRRPAFARHVAASLSTRGLWLTLTGNADEPRDGGPPRLTAAQIVAAIEPEFQILRLAAFHFVKRDRGSPLAWSCLARKRPIP